MPIETCGEAVRPIVPGDDGELVDLWRETWTCTYGPTLGSATLDRMLRSLADGVSTMLPGHGERGYCVASGTRICGTAIVAERGAIAYLWGMYVRPDRQRSGIGSRVLAAVAQSIASSERIEARVLHTSPQALAFYRAVGFRPVGEETTEILSALALPTSVLSADVAALRRCMRP